MRAPSAQLWRALCGYELTRDLDFRQESSYAAGSPLWTSKRYIPVSSTVTSATAAAENGVNRGWGAFSGAFGSENSAGKTIFDGKGYEISNLYIYSNSAGGFTHYAGLFSGIDKAVIQNLRMRAAHIRVSAGNSASQAAGVIGGTMGFDGGGSSELLNCAVYDSVIDLSARANNGDRAGIFMGGIDQSSDLRAKGNYAFGNRIISTSGRAGGIVGHIWFDSDYPPWESNLIVGNQISGRQVAGLVAGVFPATLSLQDSYLSGNRLTVVGAGGGGHLAVRADGSVNILSVASYRHNSALVGPAHSTPVDGVELSLAQLTSCTDASFAVNSSNVITGLMSGLGPCGGAGASTSTFVGWDLDDWSFGTGTHGTGQYFPVLKNHVISANQQYAEIAAGNLALDFAGSDSASTVTANVSLPSSGLNTATVSWSEPTGGDPAGAVAISGNTLTVSRPISGASDARVIIRATVTVGSADPGRTTRDFELTVIALP